MKILKRIKAIVSQEEMARIDRVIEEIYSIEYDNNHSVAYNLGFDTVANHNGTGYNNLVIIVDSLNYGGEDEAFSRFILEKVFNDNKIERLQKEIEENRNRYVSILYL